MTDKEHSWDKLLQIQTGGRNESGADQYHHPYEPTSYRVLERLVASRLIHKRNVVLDYGCGKGRVDFFLSYRTKANTIGIEYDARIYQAALENRSTVISRVKPRFVCAGAEEYPAPRRIWMATVFRRCPPAAACPATKRRRRPRRCG